MPVQHPPFQLSGMGYTSVITPSGLRVSSDPTPTTFPDGTLLAASGQSATYIVSNGQLRWIPNGATFNAMGFTVSQIRYVQPTVLNAIPMGQPMPDLSGGYAPTSPPPTPTPTSPPASPPAATAPTSVTPTGAVASVLEPGAVWNATVGGYVNPDGSTYYGAGSSSTAPGLITPTPTGVVATTIEPGATYDASIGGYLNPDGSVYYGASTTATSAIDITSPSTWPWYMWAVGVGGLYLLLKKK
jgi:hypothetical protein